MLKLFLADLKMVVRNRQSLFWALMFPLIFTFIFGFFFGNNTNLGTIAVVNKSKSEIASGLVSAIEKSELYVVNKADELLVAKDEIKKAKISAVVYLPENFGALPNESKNIEIIYDQGSQTISGLSGIVGGYLTSVNYQIQNSKPVFSLKSEPASDKKLNYFDFVLAGILGMALMNSSIIGVGVSMAKYREDKILKRITMTPLKSYVFIVSQILSRLVVNVVQILLILSIGKYFFHAHIYGNIFVIFAVAMIGAIMFQLFGFFVAAATKTTEAAEGMATAITIPMMFLAGVFFPIDSLPKWLYSIVQYLPLAPLLRIIRGVMLEGNSPFFEPRNIIIIGCWIFAILTVVIWRFRLSDE